MKIVRTVYSIIAFLVFYLKNLVQANIKIAYDIITPDYRMEPGILKIPLYNKTDIGILILNNLITMTPGTICVNVDEDRNFIYVHTMYVKDRDSAVEDIEKLEAETNKILSK